MIDERRLQGHERCQALKSDGRPCTAIATVGVYCIGHSEYASEETRRKGGSATSIASRAARLLPARLRPVADRLELALQQVHEGQLDPRVAVAMASLARALVAVFSAGELEERLKQLEQRLTD